MSVRVNGCGSNHTGALQQCCCVYRTNSNFNHHCNVAQEVRADSIDYRVEGSTPSIATT